MFRGRINRMSFILGMLLSVLMFLPLLILSTYLSAFISNVLNIKSTQIIVYISMFITYGIDLIYISSLYIRRIHDYENQLKQKRKAVNLGNMSFSLDTSSIYTQGDPNPNVFGLPPSSGLHLP